MDSGLAGAIGGDTTDGGGSDVRWPIDAVAGADSGTAPAGFVTWGAASSSLRLPNTTIPHAIDYFDRNLSRSGAKSRLRGFFVSLRPVNRCAICRKISVVRWLAEISA